MAFKFPPIRFIALCLCTLAVCAAQAGAVSDMPPTSLKVPAMVPEQSVSTFIPSEAAPGEGLAVNIIYPSRPRYKEGAPLVVVIPGGTTSDGLEFSMHAAQAGFAEVRFALPGGGRPGFTSGGAFDYRGSRSAQALMDIMQFAAGKKKDKQGRSAAELVPVKLVYSNLGAVGWSNGGNLLLTTLGKYAAELNFIKWIAFYESPVGPLFFPPALGSNSDLIPNKHYRQGSCATGECLLDLRRLCWQADGQKDPGSHKRLGEPELKGVFFFDENKNKQWEEVSEFALPYAGYPGFEKQFYPPVILHAAARLKLFEVTRKVEKKKEEKEEDKKKQEAENGNEGTAKKLLGMVLGKQEKKKYEPDKFETVVAWPENLATIAESEKYFQERDGSVYIKDVCEKMPKLLVEIFGSSTDHLQAQPDHPHIAYLYNTFLANKLWVRLNPDPLYCGQISGMNARTFIDNKPNASLEAAEIEQQLEQEGLMPDYAFMDATIAELADRTKTHKLGDILTEPLAAYSNGAETTEKP
jgi:hypothetical protein